ncbi:hypothetical protein [Hymenobacter volaticus]|uniref:Uncharacterized protein n=1 Tax=Hymenobacter volaticus TaxID=2932254 RepID=A0ABY4GE94_9BACT|nr:hypothetical protein [Hymenobacter volaticus]UOQ69250.1 hypothetical protein MUN86_27745 [Hymenobacter volaticus]
MTHALLLGSYNGRYTFILPLVTIEEMRSGNRTAKAIAQPLYFQETNTYYPTTYNVYVNAQKQTHYLTLGGFVRR